MKKVRILIVEDEILVARDLQMHLEQMGYAVAAMVPSGKQAIQEIENEVPDLVLMDIVLQEGMDGVETAEIIHSRFDIPVIFLTAHEDKVMFKRAKKAEPFGYVTKPFQEEDLRKVIEIALLRHNAERKRKMLAQKQREEFNESLEERNIKHRHIERVLRKSEEEISKLTHAVEQSSSAVVITDAKGKIEYTNPEFTRVTGYTAQETLGLNPRILKTDKTPPEEYKRLLKTIVSGSEWSGEFCNKKKNGELYWERASISPVKNREGVITNFIAVKENVTERKRVEIHEKRIMFTTCFSRSCRDFVELKPIVELATKGLAEQLNVQRASVWILDDSNNLVCQKLYEHPKGSFSEGTVLSGERYPDYVKAILNDYPLDAHNARTDLRTKEFLNDYLLPLNIYSMLDTPIKLKGKVSGVLCLEQTKNIRYWQKDEIDFANTITAQLSNAIDRITERKKTEEALKLSNEQMQSILDNTTAVIYLKGLQGKYIFINRQYQNLFHITKEEIIGKTDYDIFPKEMADAFQANDQKVIKARAPLEMEEVALRDDGPHTYISIKFPLFDSNGILYGVCGISTDITDRKKTEDILREQKESLEQKNIALSEVLRQIEIEKRQIEDNVIANAENLLLPTIQKLGLTAESRKYAQLLQKNLEELTSSFGTRLVDKKTRLSAREIEICNMIKNGLTSKEIARLLNASLLTVEKHRNNIRTKLGIANKKISNKKVSLFSVLQEL